MAQQKFLDLTGLSLYDQKIKAKIKTDDDTTLRTAKEYADGLSKNYDAAGTAEEKVNALKNTEVAANAAAIAKLNGEESEVGSVKKAVKDLEDKLTPTIESKADKATTLAGYGINDAYTKGETDSAIATAIAKAPHLKREIVEVLPEVEAADENTIYMVGTGAGSQDSAYDEYMLINGAFEKIGSSAVDLTNYATKEYVGTAKAEAISTATEAASQLVTKLEQGQVTTNKNDITAIKGRLDTLEDTTFIAITTEEIEALFN